MRREERAVVKLSAAEKAVLTELARQGGDVPLAAVVRALIRREARELGLWPVAQPKEVRPCSK